MDLDTLIAELISAVIREFPTTTQATELTADEIAEQLDLLFFRVPDLFAEYRDRAWVGGWASVVGQVPDDAPDGPDDEETAAALRTWWKEQRRMLHALADTPGITSDVVVARARSLIEREASTQLVQTHSAAVLTAAENQGLTAVLQPERDACLLCTSYAGAICEPGAGGVLPVHNFTAGDLARERVTLPLHPRCRCDWVLVGSTEERDARTAALRREAERSVLRFDSLPSESDRARTEAAARLLDEGTQLAKTVVERSQRAVRRRRKEEQPTRARKG